MSETAISRLTISRPLALRTFRLRLFLLTLVSLKFPEVFRLTSRCCGVVVLGSRPRSFSGHSILMISAPRAPSQRVAHGPARTQLKSTTRMFSRARGRDMASFSCWGQARERGVAFGLMPSPSPPANHEALRRRLNSADLVPAELEHSRTAGLPDCPYGNARPRPAPRCSRCYLQRIPAIRTPHGPASRSMTVISDTACDEKTAFLVSP